MVKFPKVPKGHVSSNGLSRERIRLPGVRTDGFDVIPVELRRAFTGAWTLIADVSVYLDLGDGRIIDDTRRVELRVRQTGRKERA